MRAVLLFSICIASSFIELLANRNVGHYKGGSITWKADENNPNNVNVFYRLNFRHHYTNGYLHNQCTDQAIEDRSVLNTEGSFRVDGQWISWAKYICTDYDDAMDWSAGYFIMPYTLEPGQTRVDVNFKECCWPTTVANNGNDQGNGRGWNMVSTIDISPRPDTGRPNSPPVAGSFPVYRLYRGCKYTRYIRAWDADGDMLRCRWTDPNRNECNDDDGDICGELYVNADRTKKGAILEEDTCKITFNRRNPAGTYAVALMIEDYSPSDPSTPLSRIPVQFLIEVHPKDGRCRKPELIGEDGTCTTIPAGRETRIPLRARSSFPDYPITSFETIKPSGVHVTPLRRVDGSNDEYTVTLSWVPTRDQIGRHVICYEAEEAYKFSSDMFCMYVNVVDAADFGPPLVVDPYESTPRPGARLRGDTISIAYSREIRKASRSTFISILEASNNPLYQVDSSSSDVTVSGQTLSFTLPYDLPLQRGTAYKVRVDEGVAKSAVDCEAAPLGDEWMFVFESFCDGDNTPLVVSPAESVPAPGAEMFGNVVSVTYNKEIQQPSSSAYVTIYDRTGSSIFRVDTSTADVTVSGRTLSFSVPLTLSLEHRGWYRLRVDEGAVVSARACEQGFPPMAEWDFVFVTFCSDEEPYEPLTVLPSQSVPSPGENFAGQTVMIKYNKEIQKSSDSAYITMLDAFGFPVLQVDTSSPDVTIDGDTLSFVLSLGLPLQFGGGYSIRVDEGAVRSAQDCDLVPPPPAEWDFVFVTFCRDEESYEPLTVLPSQSVPFPGENFAGQTMMIKYNKEIQKSSDSAYITILDAFGFPILQVDTSSPDVTIDGDTLSFVLSLGLPLQFGGGYSIRVDEGAVRSAQDCDLVPPPPAEWEFGFVTFCPDGGDYEPLSVRPTESSPYPGQNFAGRMMKIGFNKQIQKPLRPAYISLFDSTDTLLFQVDAASPDVSIVEGTSLGFTLPLDLPLESQGEYKLRVDGWAALSAQDCDLSRPDTAEWRFTFLTFCQDGGADFEPLAVVPLESQPRPGGNISGYDVTIQYNKPIRKPLSPAHVRIMNSEESAVYEVDTTSDEVTIEGRALKFSLPVAASVFFGFDYKIVVDEGAARSTKECDVTVPTGADWRFKWTGRTSPAELEKKPVVSSQPTGNADCRENFMQTFVSKRLVGGIDPTSMYLNDKSCTGREYNKTHYVIGTSYDACQTVPEVIGNGRKMAFRNVVYIPPQPYTPGSEITRDHFIEIHLTCRVPTDRISYLSFDPNVTTIVYYEEGYGNFNFSLRMYEDESFARAYRPREFPVGVQLDQPMHFEGRVTCDGNCDLMIDNCWATPTSNPFDVTRFPFITKGCPVDDTVVLLDSPSSKRERFAINSFAFLGDNIHGTVYVHCDMRICDVNDPNSRCTMGCDSDSPSSPGIPSPDDNVLRPEVPNRGDVPHSELPQRRKRDLTRVGSSSAAYPSTGGQLRFDGEKIDANQNQMKMAVNPDVVEIAMLGTIIFLLVVLVFMQCRRTSGAAGKDSTLEV
ncbi:uncharacterized protein LOC110985951 [Acanthaster planci]|uniref:Uncharacterized protein LOC110985951 n=1 Tax=Acanthaster planci TaxID=133434 RepID=A0A8B7ZBT9_ACAPL|nr:uncharacterized protein LOC110985951 [Acanthaster planci]